MAEQVGLSKTFTCLLAQTFCSVFFVSLPSNRSHFFHPVVVSKAFFDRANEPHIINLEVVLKFSQINGFLHCNIQYRQIDKLLLNIFYGMSTLQ